MNIIVECLCAVLFAGVVIGLSFYFVAIPVMENSLIYEACCNSTPCTDTYYTAKDNTCHLVLCENNKMFFNNCTYPGKELNLSMINTYLPY